MVFAWLFALGLLTVPQQAGPSPDAMTAAERAFDSGRVREAATRFRAITEANPSSPRAWYGLGRSYELLARQTFAQLQKVASGSTWEALLVAEVWVTAGRHAQALEVYREVQKVAPGTPGVHEAVADLYGRAGKPEWAAAERQRIPAQPATCKPGQADCEFLAGRYLAAVDATAARDDARSLYWRTRAYNALATDAFASLDELPASAEVHLVRASLYSDQGRASEAVPELKAALALKPGDPEIQMELASALYEARNLHEALPLLAKLAGTPQQATAEQAFFYGDALLQAQQVESALPYLRAAAEKRPGEGAIQASLGRALLQHGDAAAAIRHLEAAAKDEPQDSDGTTYYHLAQAYQRLGLADKAKAALAIYQARQAAQSGEAPSPQAAPVLTPP